MSNTVLNNVSSKDLLLQFRIVNNTNASIPNIPFMTSNPTFNALTQYQWALPPDLNNYHLINPTITIKTTPDLAALLPFSVGTVNGLTYESIVESIPTNNYNANFIYAYSPNCPQVNQSFTLNQGDIAGNATTNQMPFVIDPYQTQCSVFYYPAKDSVIFDGTSLISFTMLPQTAMGLKMYSTVESSSLKMDNVQSFKNNPFVQAQDELGINLFDDYCNYLIDL